jgi:type IV secretory pathway VirB2 component (pilin)
MQSMHEKAKTSALPFLNISTSRYSKHLNLLCIIRGNFAKFLIVMFIIFFCRISKNFRPMKHYRYPDAVA